MIPVYVVDIIGEVVAAMQDTNNSEQVLSNIKAGEKAALGDSLIRVIDYQYGHKLELIETLSQMDKDDTMREKKYPCIYLVQDFSEKRNDPTMYATVNLNVIIMHHSQQAFKITDRYNKVFKPVLYPLYYSFIHELAKHKSVMEYPEEAIEHIKTDRGYWGRKLLIENATVNDFVDAIEIENLTLKLNFNC